MPAGPRSPPHDAARAWEEGAAPRRKLTLGEGDHSASGRRPRGALSNDSQPADGPLRVLVLFAGPGESDSHLPLHLRAVGCVVTAVDTKLGGSAHDVLRAAVGQPILDQIQAGTFHAVFIATPCSSYSVRHDPTLRSSTEPKGIEPIPSSWVAYVAKHNALAEFTARAIDACRASATPVAVENPASRSDPQSPAWWPKYSDHGSLWHMPCIAAALGAYHARFHTFAQCSFHERGAGSQKWTTVAAAGGMTRTLAGLGSARYACQHGREAHPEVLSGRDALGRSRAGMAAAYPRALNELLATAIATAAQARRASAQRAHPRAPAPGPQLSLPTVCEGCVVDGPALGPVGHAACEAARSLPDSFAHPDHLIAASDEELRAEPFPGDLASPVTSLRPRSACAAKRRRPLPHTRWACAQVGCCAHGECEPGLCCAPPAPSPRPQPGASVAVAELFLPGVYAEQVRTWFALADAAAAAIRAGERPPSVPTRVIAQDQLQPWARGVIWDCRDPADCRPVQRSTRCTEFPGSRQVDRGAIRRIAELLGWHDDDLIDQIGEGGMEVRSDCSLDIVLAFHHPSLIEEVDLAARAVADHVREQWVAPPTRDLPFVPCRLAPRGVIMQPRSRLMADGVTLEEYEKPRITTDSSFGGVDSVNGGVPDAERSVALPSAQALGRGWAICRSAFSSPASPAGDGCVAGYCIDAESAYSFCPIQVADLWTQCFCWWDEGGASGTAIDLRMGFGGAFAPNRFERLSTLVAAYAQHLQAEFDAGQPPAAASQFTAERRSLQRVGQLPPGDSQCHPRYLQVFVDDFTGVAGTDSVAVPASVAHIQVADEHMRAAGCVPALASSRVHVHARLTIVALTTAGLYAAPHKVAIGTPLPALGLLMDGAARIIRCPPGKRASALADISRQRQAALTAGDVDRRRARRLVGRLCHLAQVSPHMRPHLHGGHAVAEANWKGSGGARGVGHMHLAVGGHAHTAWLRLLDEASAALAANEGVSMAPRRVALPRTVAGTLTAFTDASGEDGFGGYAFLAERPGEIFILSEPWPPHALAALKASSSQAEANLRRDGSEAAQPHLAMPAAELFAQVALPRAVSRLAHISAVYAVGDCQPSAHVVAAMHSRKPAMRQLVEAAREGAIPWVSVHVHREANVDADRLSHPDMLSDVIADAVAAGFLGESVHVLALAASDWALLDTAIATSPHSHPKRRKRRREGGAGAAHPPGRPPPPAQPQPPPGNSQRVGLSREA